MDLKGYKGYTREYDKEHVMEKSNISKRQLRVIKVINKKISRKKLSIFILI